MAPVYLGLCLLLGGASAAGFLANGMLQFLGLICILIVVLTNSLPALRGDARTLLILLGAAGALLAFELIPLPPFLWSILPGRDWVVDGYAAMGIDRPWLPISLAPDGTLMTLTSLIVPVAMALLIFASTGYGRIYCVFVMIAIAVLSIFLGVLQRMQGPDSLYYIYEITNRGGVVGFFANRNHLATFLLMTLPFIGALAADPKSASRSTDRDDSRVGRLMITGCLALLLAVGVVIVGSAAGWFLLLPTIFGAVAVLVRSEKGRVPPALVQTGLFVAVVCLVAAIVAPLQVNDLGDKLSGINPQLRNMSIRTTAMAALDYLPFGSGAQSFSLIYPHYEDAANASLEFMNHAHSDYVEVFLEHGIPGLVLIGAALYFWVRQTGKQWRKGKGEPLTRASFIAMGVLFAHSLVDYPGRTAAIAALFAMSAAMMVAPASEEMPSWQTKHRRRSRGKKSARRIEIALSDQ
ncbi:O-antigen ligase family protein [Novosphingobium aquimarinum]|uniref:O-antigen ligase family protein n=1 Tax=Novosphingobium aquimarinum TaxID=2682494 RepID=UPI0012EB3A31|nr:O-antigen ligase family protein [Novosphingobium aquimarinum]